MAILGAAAGGAFPQITLTQSQTYVMPQDGNVCIHVVGAGAGGAGWSTGPRSGGSGAYCKKTSLVVTAGGSFTVVVGVGGAGGHYNVGVAGGSSTVAGPGLSATLTANGGTGGTSSANGVGGSASNGDVNNQGGAGTGYGGGSVGIYGTGRSGSYTSPGCDAMGGGLAMSGFGQIVGGQGSSMTGSYGHQYFNGSNVMVSSDQRNGGDLCGGASINISMLMYFPAGNGGVGGGGGGGRNSQSSRGVGGRGGDGVVLIQYLA